MMLGGRDDNIALGIGTGLGIGRPIAWRLVAWTATSHGMR
jgi:hypothetical protein